MYVIRLSLDSPYTLYFPRTYQWDAWIDLAFTFIRYDQSLPPEQQSRIASIVMRELSACMPLYNSYHASKVQCAIALRALQQLDAQVDLLCQEVHRTMREASRQGSVQTEAWGFPIKQSTGVLVRPHSRRGKLALLERYVAQEERRPAEERFSGPDLTTVKRVRDALAVNIAAYHSAVEQRRASRDAGLEAFRHLSISIRIASMMLVLTQFDREVSFELQKWGFVIIERESGEVVPRMDQSALSDVEPAEAIADDNLLSTEEEVGSKK